MGITKLFSKLSIKALFGSQFVETYLIVNAIIKKLYFLARKYSSRLNRDTSRLNRDTRKIFWNRKLKIYKILVSISAGFLTPLFFIYKLLRYFLTLNLKINDLNYSYRIRFDHKDRTMVFFAPIDWDYRVQRPQQLAIQFQQMGFHVIYFNPTIQTGWKQITPISVKVVNGIQVCTLHSNLFIKDCYIGIEGFPSKLSTLMAKNIEDFISRHTSNSVILLIQQPSWWPLVERLQGNQIVFDCMDLHIGFESIDSKTMQLESILDKSADSIIVTSSNLLRSKENILNKPVVLIKNGVDNSTFYYKNSVQNSNTITVGYFGAIAEWFDVDLMEYLLIMNSQVKFEIIGLVSNPAIFARLNKFPNISFKGEVPNTEVPNLVRHWKAGLIPFIVSDLIKATNPVKVYEYAAIGIPTVSTAIPEVELIALETEGVFASLTYEDFNQNLGQAVLGEKFETMDLVAWAKKNDWSTRAKEIVQLIQLTPKVSVIILMWNQGQLTLNCLKSVLQRSDYENLEIILVDNNSYPEEVSIVMSWVSTHAKQKVIYLKNDENLGFAAGNNKGLQIATGDYLVILNNDTEVSPGWIWRSLKHFHRNPKLGLLGPSTDNCGNEARVLLRGSEANWLQEAVTRFNFRVPSLLSVDTIAFFCVFLKREVFNQVGMISEEYGRGYFEDDDYCRRAQSKGFEIGIARDIFVHHYLGASFNLLDNFEKTKIFNHNREIYEAKWGPWRPHVYALDVDQI